MAKYKIPAVYVEEIPIVETIKSIPDTAVFLGYTEKHQNSLGENLFNISTTITSLSDFQSNFGKAQKEENIEITNNVYNILSIILMIKWCLNNRQKHF